MLLRSIYCYLLFAFAILACCSCSYKSRNLLFKTNNEISSDSIKTVYVVQKGNGEAHGPYRLQPGDRLTIRNLQNPTVLSGDEKTALVAQQTFLIGVDSLLTIPALGKVNLTGLTVAEAEQKLQSLYADKILNRPIIEITVSNFQATVLGEVKNPNKYVLDRENTSLVELLGQAGGPTIRANLNRVKIVRGDPQNPEILFINLENSETIKDPRLQIQNRDVVYIEPTKLNGTGDRVSGFSALIQPILIVINTFLVIFTLTRK
jgi:polysaccharide export outer membrane protein